MHPADRTPERCPNCQTPLSPWERVLLSVDHALRCKACGYQIRFDEFSDKGPLNSQSETKES